MFLEKFTNARFDCTIYHAFNRILKQYAEVPQWVFCKYLSLISRVSYKAGLFLSPFSSALCRWISLSSVIIFTKVGILLDDTIFCTPWNRLSIRRKLWRGLQSLVIKGNNSETSRTPPIARKWVPMNRSLPILHQTDLTIIYFGI